MINRRDHTYKYHKNGDHQVMFEIANEDLAGDPQYFGYLSESGSWMIQKRAVATGIYTYAIGQSAYSTSWTNRAGTVVYTTFDAL